jgi:hypothetical protein
MDDIAINEGQKIFEERYKKGFPKVIFGETHISIPCTCDDGGGPIHWATVQNNIRSIEEHFRHEETLRELRKMDRDKT